MRTALLTAAALFASSPVMAQDLCRVSTSDAAGRDWQVFEEETHRISFDMGRTWTKCETTFLWAKDEAFKRKHGKFYSGLHPTEYDSVSEGIDCNGLLFRDRVSKARAIRSKEGRWYFVQYGTWPDGFIVDSSDCKKEKTSQGTKLTREFYDNMQLYEMGGSTIRLERVSINGFIKPDAQAQGTFTF